MDYSIRTENHYTIIALTGDVDLHYSPKAREQILKYLHDNIHVLVDLSGVTYIDSSGVASLVEGFQLARKNNLEFGLLGVSDAALQVLQLARLDKVFPIHKSVSERMENYEQTK
jgi:anti-sigma B factor antagonist